jgi:long-subunit fatty acid transport protein
MSYKVSVNAAFSYSYEFSSTYTLKNTVSSQTQKSKSPDSAGGGLSLGVGWRASEKTTLSFGLSYSLTGTNFSLSIRAPFSFVL